MTKKCHCIIAHANTPEQRKEVEELKTYFESIGDTHGVKLCEMRLANGDCPARLEEETP